MSLEDALAANTAALTANTAALLGEALKKGRPTKAETAAAATAGAPATGSPTLPTGAAQGSVGGAAAPGAPTAKGAADKVIAVVSSKVAGAGRAAAIALLGKYGAAKASDLKLEQIGPFIADADAILAGNAATAPATAGNDLC